MDILFYSKRDNYSNKVVSQYSNLNNIKFVCIEDNKFPSFITSVPSLFIVNQKKVLLDRDIIDYIETFLNKSSPNNFNQQQQQQSNNFNQQQQQQQQQSNNFNQQQQQQQQSNNFNQQQQQQPNNNDQIKRNIDFTDPNYKSPMLNNSDHAELMDNYGKDSFSNVFSNLDNDDIVSNYFMIEEESNDSSTSNNSLHIKNEKKNVFNNQFEKYQNGREDFNSIKRI